MTTNAVKTGVLARWLKDRGFGFIRPDHAGPEVFVHNSDLLEEIPIGSRVLYQTQIFNDRPKAVNVRAEAVQQ